MRKIILSVILLIIVCDLWSQGFSIGIAEGYSLGALKQTCGTEGVITYYNYASEGSKSKPFKTSLGEGFNFQLDISDVFDKNMEVGLVTNYHNGLPFTFKNKVEFNNYSSGHSFKNSTEEISKFNHISQIQFNPYLKISTGEATKPYMKFGFLIGCLGKIEKEWEQNTVIQDEIPPTYYDTTYSHTTKEITIYKGGISIGFTGAVGIETKLMNNLFFTAECSFSGMQWAPNKSKRIEWTYDGANQLYGKDNFNSIEDENKTYWSYSNVGIQVGVKFIFEKKDKLKTKV
jgi:hypothetical protein